MKVKLTDVEEGVFAFLKEVIATMPTTGHKFLAGAMLASKAKAVEDALMSFADADGAIDTDALRQAVQAGFAASGDKVSFTVSDDRIAWLVKPVTVNISFEDLEKIILQAENRAR